jgi:hypothetical protein
MKKYESKIADNKSHKLTSVAVYYGHIVTESVPTECEDPDYENADEGGRGNELYKNVLAKP